MTTQIWNPNIYRALLISVLLLVVQYEAILHAVEHPFHAHEESCNVYFLAEHLGDGLVAVVCFPMILLVGGYNFLFAIRPFYGQNPTYFLARAPPPYLV